MCKSGMLLFILCLFGKCCFSCVSKSLIIDLPQGKIKGLYGLDNTQREFLGIPYASIPERFKEPGKPPTWDGTFTADRREILCNQYDQEANMPTGQENCLVVNVFTPTVQEAKPFPVMAFLHGGGFYRRSNTEKIYNPRYLVKEKVIVVTINYRLGAFGFLCLGIKKAPGNVGIKDQIAALQWIRNNIAYFGGDPDGVTVFGQSAGGISINYLLFSNNAQGLFQRAILDSGTFLEAHALTYTPIKSASDVALRLGYNTTDPNELLRIFKKTSADEIVRATYRDPTNNAYANFIFIPCLETPVTSKRPLITEQPRDLLKKNGLNISVIVGFNNKEGIIYANQYVPITREKVKEKLSGLVPNNLFFENKASKDSVVDKIEALYFNNETAQNGLIDFFTDSIFRYSLTAVSEALTRKPNRSVYNYYFTYDSARNYQKLMTRLAAVPGADHGDELFYLFDPDYSMQPPLPNDRRMIEIMTKLWTSFAKTGVPSAPNIIWEPSKEQLHFIELGENIGITALPNENRIDFWKEVYEMYGQT